TWNTDEVISANDAPASPTRFGYTFAGWSTLPYTVVAGTNTITAMWSANIQTVEWDYAGGTDSSGNTKYTDNSTWHTGESIMASDAPATPTRTGYTFTGWSMLPYTVIDGTNTITAIWSANSQTVEWDYAGGTDGSGNTKYTDSST